MRRLGGRSVSVKLPCTPSFGRFVHARSSDVRRGGLPSTGLVRVLSKRGSGYRKLYDRMRSRFHFRRNDISGLNRRVRAYYSLRTARSN